MFQCGPMGPLRLSLISSLNVTASNFLYLKRNIIFIVKLTNRDLYRIILEQKLFNYLFREITLVPEPVSVPDSQEITHHDSAEENYSVTLPSPKNIELSCTEHSIPPFCQKPQ